MKKIYNTLLIIVCLLFNLNNLFSASPNLLFKIGGSQQDYGRSIDLDSAGNIYILGDFNSSNLNFNNGVTLSGDGLGDIFLAKYNSSGICQWAQKIYGAGTDQATQLKVDKHGNIYLVGYYSSANLTFNNGKTINNIGSNDAFLSKYNTNGTCQWAINIAGNNSDLANSIDLDSSGNIYISGTFTSSSINMNNGKFLNNFSSLDIFIAKYNNSGLCQWAEKIAGTGLDNIFTIKVDNDNNVYTAGYYSSATLNFNNGFSLSNSGLSDVFISKYSSAGVCQWVQKIYGSATDEAYSLDLDSKNNVYVIGSFNSPILNFGSFISLNNFSQRDVFITKLDNNGNFKWANKYYGNNNDYGKFIHIDKYNNIWSAGDYNSDSLIFPSNRKLEQVQGVDSYISILDTNGNVKNLSRIYGNSSDYLESIASNENGQIIFTGYFNSPKLYTNEDSLSQTSLNDVFVTSMIGGNTAGAVLADIISPFDNQIGVTIQPIFEGNKDKSFIVYLSTDSTFATNSDTLISNGKFLNLPYNLKYNTLYYAKSNNIIKFTTEVIKKEQVWNWRNSYPQGNDLNVIKLYSETSVLAMGDLMTIIQSSDGGTSWKVRKTGATNMFNSVYFSSYDSTIFGCGDYGTIFKSLDKGENWEEIKIGTNKNINAMVLADKNAGWVVGNEGTIFKTTNGGNSWVSQNSQVFENLNYVSFPNLNIGYVAGNKGTILKTSNGGSTWNKLTAFTSKNIQNITFLNLNKGFAIGDSGVFYKTTNGGNNWTAIDLSTKQNLRDIKFVNSTTAFLVADSGLIYKSNDGGNNWTKKATANISNLFSINFYNSSIGIACGEKGVLLKTTNGGESWENQLVDKLGNVNLSSIRFINDNDAYIDLSPDTLYLKSTNGGNSWFYQSIGIRVNKLFFINSNIGWAVGDSGKIIKTTDGGISWKSKPSNTTVNLVNLSFISQDRGWATGNNGYLLITNDGGENWLSQNVGSDNNYLQVIFTDNNNGWVITNQSEILYTSDGGTNWNYQINPSDASLTKLFFLNNQIGWGIFGNNNIIKTTDGGANWQLVNTGYTNIKDIFFVDNFNGWATGDRIIYTSDGGDTWYQQGQVTRNKINGLYFKNYNHGWGVGENGTILEFDNTDFVILAPDLIEPENNSINISIIPNFEWSKPSKSNKYRLQISSNSSFTNIIYDVTTINNSLKLLINDKLNQNTIYYWRVKASDDIDSSFWSVAYSFKTQAQLVQATLLTPNNGNFNTIHKPQFSWTSVPFADKYYIQLSTSLTFDPLNTKNDTTNSNSFIPANFLSQVTNYFWRVKAANEANESDWSSIFTFTTDTIAIPDVPTLLSPANNSIDVVKIGYVLWNKAAHSVYYRLQIAKDSNFTNLVIDSTNIIDTNYHYTSLEISSKYYWRVKSYNWLGDESSWSSKRNFTTITYEIIPDTWNIVSNTGNNATILVPLAINPKIDKRNIVRGDVIGVFYSRGSEIYCAGYGIWNNQNLSITVWGDDTQTPIKDGYAIGEKYFLKFWDGQVGREIYANFTIASGPDSYDIDGLTILGQANGITPSYNNIYLPIGWNLISSYVKPENGQMEAVFDKIKSSISIVKNKYGNSYIPAFGINNIGKWDYKQAYQVYMVSSDTLKVKGIAVTPENETINLLLGWYFVAYLKNTDNSIVSSLATLTNTNSLFICKNNAGQVYIPQYSINTIGNMKVGQGYNMYITNPPAQLTYPANPPTKGSINTITPLPKYLIPDTKETGNYSVVLAYTDAENYNELGAYNSNGQLVGSGCVFNGIATIIIWGNNEETELIEGALNNEKITFKFYDTKSSTLRDVNLVEVYNLISQYTENEYRYSANQVLRATIKENNLGDGIELYPIPANDKVTVKSSVNINQIEIYNLEGRLINSLKLNHNINSNTINIDLNDLQNGEYNLLLITDTGITHKKLIIKR
ncbi:MAG TPA: YCF48-related protein [Candidatus Kapabacteria bacterium]|nr:YCF48-related protein [Candidatus Kapabacteria bacterium]